MSSYWFISAPLFSHLDWGGFLKTAQHLQHMGHEVVWVSGEAIQAPVESAGLTFTAIEETGMALAPAATA